MPVDGVIQEQIIDKASASEIKRGASSSAACVRCAWTASTSCSTTQTTPEEILRVTQLDIA